MGLTLTYTPVTMDSKSITRTRQFIAQLQPLIPPPPGTIRIKTTSIAYNGPVAILVSYDNPWTGASNVPNRSCAPAPTGIASYGVYRNTSTAYNVSTSEVVGYMNLCRFRVNHRQSNPKLISAPNRSGRCTRESCD